MIKKVLSFIIGVSELTKAAFKWWKASKKERYEKTVDKVVSKRDVNTANRILRNIAKTRKKRRDRS